jgi:hypothetical protein
VRRCEGWGRARSAPRCRLPVARRQHNYSGSTRARSGRRPSRPPPPAASSAATAIGVGAASPSLRVDARSVASVDTRREIRERLARDRPASHQSKRVCPASAVDAASQGCDGSRSRCLRIVGDVHVSCGSFQLPVEPWDGGSGRSRRPRAGPRRGTEMVRSHVTKAEPFTTPAAPRGAPSVHRSAPAERPADAVRRRCAASESAEVTCRWPSAFGSRPGPSAAVSGGQRRGSPVPRLSPLPLRREQLDRHPRRQLRSR